MTEAEWLASKFVYDLIEHVDAALSARKGRLLGCVCVGWLWHWGMEEEIPQAVHIAEAFADGLATAEAMRGAAEEMKALGRDHNEPWRAYPRLCDVTAELAWPESPLAWLDELHAYTAEININGDLECAKTADFARDVIGNPFRPVAFDTAWRTSTAVALARQMYEPREFSAMPILADALQDAGCEIEELLDHCRDTNQVHVRGCWVVDLVLGKS